jgi:glyoxylase-like metal-dependent hydrolase (beta-lactamase superfamily II)
MRLSPSCYAVTGLGYYAPWSVNAGIVAGGSTTLIVDTGGSSLAAATIHGYARCVKPDNALRVINTEKHFDHIGGNSYFSRHGVEIWGHPGIQRSAEEFHSEIREFNDGIADPVRRARNEANIFFAGTRLKMPDRAVSADTGFDLGDCPVTIIMTPGHTPTNLSVWVAKERVLICGDCLANGYLPNLDGGTVAGWEAWLRSLDRVEGLEPRIVVPGHGAVMAGESIRLMIDHHRQVIIESIRRATD